MRTPQLASQTGESKFPATRHWSWRHHGQLSRPERKRQSLLWFAWSLRKKEHHAGITFETDPFRENVSKSNPMQEICKGSRITSFGFGLEYFIDWSTYILSLSRFPLFLSSQFSENVIILGFFSLEDQSTELWDCEGDRILWRAGCQPYSIGSRDKESLLHEGDNVIINPFFLVCIICSLFISNNGIMKLIIWADDTVLRRAT